MAAAPPYEMRISARLKKGETLFQATFLPGVWSAFAHLARRRDTALGRLRTRTRRRCACIWGQRCCWLVAARVVTEADAGVSGTHVVHSGVRSSPVLCPTASASVHPAADA
jgi:hypothetical protein